MGTKILRRGTCLALAALLLATQASYVFAGSSATVTSDRPDYAPGDTVTLIGSGWDPAEAIHLNVNDNVGQTWSFNADVVADDLGTFTSSFQLPSWFVALYLVTATGATSGTTTTTFTDASKPSSSVTFPAQNGYYSAASWDAGCAAAGFCGTATGGSSGGPGGGTPFNLTGITVAISKGTGVAARWWDGTGFTQTSQSFVSGTLSGSGHGPLNWSYAFGHGSFPEENTYKVVPQATDTNSTETGNAGTTFFIDRTAPTSSITCNATVCAGTYSGSVTVGLAASDPTLGSTGIAGSGSSRSGTRPMAVTRGRAARPRPSVGRAGVSPSRRRGRSTGPRMTTRGM